jgi:hypothetical protein
MPTDAASLSRTVSAIRPMVPAKDFEISKRFHIELGFQSHDEFRSRSEILQRKR